MVQSPPGQRFFPKSSSQVISVDGPAIKGTSSASTLAVRVNAAKPNLDVASPSRSVSATHDAVHVNAAKPNLDVATVRSKIEHRGLILRCLPAAVFALPETPIEAVVSLRRFPSEAFAPPERISEVITVVPPALPANVFAAAEPRSTVVTVIPPALPADVFAPSPREPRSGRRICQIFPPICSPPLSTARFWLNQPKRCMGNVKMRSSGSLGNWESDTCASETQPPFGWTSNFVAPHQSSWDQDFEEPRLRSGYLDHGSVAVSDRPMTGTIVDRDEFIWSKLKSGVDRRGRHPRAIRSGGLKSIMLLESPGLAQRDISHTEGARNGPGVPPDVPGADSLGRQGGGDLGRGQGGGPR